MDIGGKDIDTHLRRDVWEEIEVEVRPGRPFWQRTMPDPGAWCIDTLS
jgi:hypothetical protein